MRDNEAGRKALGSAQLICAALIWGVAFVAQSVANSYMEPFTFGVVRSLLAMITIAIMIHIFDIIHALKEKRGESPVGIIGWTRETVVGGVVCGLFLTVASNLQQFGLIYTSAGKSGFITAMYIVLVPVIGSFTDRKSVV